MRVSFNWLQELVDLPKGTTPAIVAERLTAAGLEVESISDLAAPLAGVVVARVAAVERHPQADRLNVCVVEAGGAPLQIVCGAPNVAAGVFACLAPVGTVLPGNKKIEAGMIRGVASNGMLCSAQELGLPYTSEGLLLLPEGEAHVAAGAPVAPALGCDDVVFTLGITPNRPDALSHVGVARELAASTRSRLRAQTPTCAERGGPVDDLAHVTVEDAEGCPRYACRVIEGVVVGPSPLWLKARLAASGVRSVNTVVDVTNLVMLERGLPLHAFDYDKIAQRKNKATVIVRRATASDTLVTLDGKERALVDTDLVIADADKVLALAGVMGGASSEVTGQTTRVLLEGAFFNPARVRRTARRLALHSEASHRFERGCDPNGVIASLDRAAAMIAELAGALAEPRGTGGRVARGVVDVYPKKIAPLVVSLRPRRAERLLGVPAKLVDEANVSKLLLSLGLEVDGREAEALRFRVPTFRPDLVREIDLIEELVRLIGTDAIPATLPSRAGEAEGLFDAKRHRVLRLARTAFEAAGYDEAINLAFVAPRALDPFDGGDLPSRITLKNPLGEEMSVMRKSLLPGLLQNASTNQRRGTGAIRLYEAGNVFLGRNPAGRHPRPVAEGEILSGAAGGDAYAREAARVAAVLAGPNGAGAFDRKEVDTDFYDIKGVVEDILSALAIRTGLGTSVHTAGGGDDVPQAASGADVSASAATFAPADDRYPFLHPRARAEVWVKSQRSDGESTKTWLGVVGEVHPDLMAAYGLRGPVCVVELDLDGLARVAGARPPVRALPRFPAVRRDFAFVVDANLPAAELCARLVENGAIRGLVEDIDVFDVYQGPGVAAEKKSVAVALTLRAADRTLTDEEIQRVSAVLAEDAKVRFGAEVRSG